MPPTQDVVSDTIAAITARLAARHDGMTVLRAVTDACGSLLSAEATGVLIADPDSGRERWPSFADAMTEAGFRSMYAHPLRLMNRAVGGLNIFYAAQTDLPPPARRRAQALADLAVLGLTQERDQRRVERLAEQTLTTLNDLTHLGHAVGIVASTPNVTRTSHGHARRHRRGQRTIAARPGRGDHQRRTRSGRPPRHAAAHRPRLTPRRTARR